jgi:hypothetical protein
MRVLFSAETPLSMTSFQSVVHLLAERGHEVVVAFHEERDRTWRDDLVADLVADPAVSVEQAVEPAPDRWLELSSDLRSSLDLLQFLDPRYNETYRARAWERAPRPAAALGRSALGRHAPTRHALGRIFDVLQRTVETNAEIEEYLRERAPDVVLFTPYVGLRQIQPDFLRAAQALGLPTAICVKSWDNLSSKSLIRPQPDRLFVWNEFQRREATELHDVPADRVVVTGAQCFDEWFTWPPGPRAEFCGRIGLDPDRPFVLYTCSVPWTGQSEVEFVRKWVEGFRRAGGVLADAGVLVRPHPKRGHDWDGVDFPDLPGVVVYPRDAHAPTDRASKQDYFDSIHHSAAVVGLNTSAMIEAAIAGRSVLTMLDPDFERVQRGTIHFRYLLEVAGGLLRVAETPDEHAVQLAEAVAGTDGGESRARAFVSEFVRPNGLDVPATPIFVDEVERLAQLGRTGVRRTPGYLRPLRPMLAPLASRSARYATLGGAGDGSGRG